MFSWLSQFKLNHATRYFKAPEAKAEQRTLLSNTFTCVQCDVRGVFFSCKFKESKLSTHALCVSIALAVAS